MCRDSDAIRGAIFVVANEARGARRGGEVDAAADIGGRTLCAGRVAPDRLKAGHAPSLLFLFRLETMRGRWYLQITKM